MSAGRDIQVTNKKQSRSASAPPPASLHCPSNSSSSLVLFVLALRLEALALLALDRVEVVLLVQLFDRLGALRRDDALAACFFLRPWLSANTNLASLMLPRQKLMCSVRHLVQPQMRTLQVMQAMRAPV